jgi:2-polyprenyl-3-methyl-5-hydroxy-6-metoxy-1,4-benzoquinol methylase
LMQQRCPVCCHQGVDLFIEIEDVPVHCNLLWPTREAALNAPRGDIRLAFCNACGMIYNLALDPSRMQYTQAYENSLHFSPRFQAYAQALADRLIEQYQLRGKTIVEIGCGKGEFLSLLCQGGGNRGIGFDPSYDGSRDCGEGLGEITFIHDFYSEAYAAYAADFICCRQVLEHIQNPRDFLLRLRRAIGNRRGTVVFFEVPNVLYTLRDLGIWDIIYEHCSYFSAASLARLFTGAGFHILKLYEAYEGQFICIEASPASAILPPDVALTENLQELSGLVAVFAEHYRTKISRWRNYLRHTVQNGRRAVVWGAGSKGVTFLNTLKATDEIRYVVDVNPHKQGMFVVGSGQGIVPPNFLRSYQPHIVLVMNAVYQMEIAELLSALEVTASLSLV